jgi:hypothetical protein
MLKWIPDPPCHSAFNGGGGVRNSVACEVGPPSCHVDYRVEFPFSATCIPLNRATGPVLTGGSLPLLRFVPIGHLLTL